MIPNTDDNQPTRRPFKSRVAMRSSSSSSSDLASKERVDGFDDEEHSTGYAFDGGETNSEALGDDELRGQKYHHLSSSCTNRYAKCLELSSILLFVLGSVLYLVCSIHDYEWSQKLLELPEWLREADDDEVWMRYRLQEQYGHVLEIEMRRVGGVRRALMREQQFWSDYNDGEIYSNQLTHTQQSRNLQELIPEVLYYHKDWSELPSEIQNAYTILGYNQSAWDDGLGVGVEALGWTDLLPEQQEAAIFIGYTETIWCGLDEPSLLTSGSPTYVPSSIPTNDPSARPSANPSTSSQPTQTSIPSKIPSHRPSYRPSISYKPTNSLSPSNKPISTQPPTIKFWLLESPFYHPVTTEPSESPSYHPSNYPSSIPSNDVSLGPSNMPSTVSTISYVFYLVIEFIRMHSETNVQCYVSRA